MGTKVIAITSGKGGVGKTNIVANLAVAFSEMGKRTLIFDADLGLGNLDVLLGLAPKFNIGHVLRGDKELDEVIVKGPGGVEILPAASGIEELTQLTTNQKMDLFTKIETLNGKVDVMLIDTAAGISHNVLFFNIASHEIIVVASPEPTSIIDAYALMKVLHLKYGERRFRFVVNMAKSEREGLEVYRNISLVADRYLNISIDYLGFIPFDENVPVAVKKQKPVVELFPESRVSKGFLKLASTIDELPLSEPKDNIQFFLPKGVGVGE